MSKIQYAVICAFVLFIPISDSHAATSNYDDFIGCYGVVPNAEGSRVRMSIYYDSEGRLMEHSFGEGTDYFDAPGRLTGVAADELTNFNGPGWRAVQALVEGSEHVADGVEYVVKVSPSTIDPDYPEGGKSPFRLYDVTEGDLTKLGPLYRVRCP